MQTKIGLDTIGFVTYLVLQHSQYYCIEVFYVYIPDRNIITERFLMSFLGCETDFLLQYNNKWRSALTGDVHLPLLYRFVTAQLHFKVPAMPPASLWK